MGFELLEDGHRVCDEERGINPFTKETLILKGAPARIAFVEIELIGTSVTESCGKVDAASGSQREQNDAETRTFATVEDADRHVKDYAMRLREHGFEEVPVERSAS